MKDLIQEAQLLALKGKADEVLALMKKVENETDKMIIGSLYETALINGNR